VISIDCEPALGVNALTPLRASSVIQKVSLPTKPLKDSVLFELIVPYVPLPNGG
jgi:hypothetical protein